MSALFGKVLTPGGTVPDFPRVTVTLYAGNLVVAFTANGTEIIDSYEPSIGTDGSWRATLEPNSTITPAGTRYLVTYEGEGRTLGTVWVDFPDDGNDHYVGDVESEPPDPVPTSGALLKAENLADLPNLETALANLGWGRYTRVPAGWGDKWRAARDESGTRLVKVAVIGDSIAQGWNANPWFDNGWVGLLRAALQQQFGDGGAGFVTFDYLINSGNKLKSSGWLGTVSGNNDWDRLTTGGINWCSLKNHVAAVGALHVPMWGNNSLKVYARTDPTYGTFSYGLNGGAATNVTTNSAAAIQATTISSPPAGSQASRYTLDLVAVSGTVELYGAAGYNTLGLAVDNLCMSGREAKHLVGTTTGTGGSPTVETATALGPWDLVIFALGVNDLTQTADFPNVATNLLDCYSALKATAPNQTAPDVIFMLTNFTGSNVFGVPDNFHAAGSVASQIYRAAEGVGAAIVDMWAFAGRSSEPWNTLGYQPNLDVHPTATGQIQYESVVEPLLLA